MGERGRLRRIGESVLEELADLVGCPTEGVTAVHRNDSGWVVTVEVLELERVPETTDVMATYDVQVDEDGEIVEYSRRRRYLRAQVED